MQNIFVAHTPFHVFVAEAIVSGRSESSGAENVLLLELGAGYRHANQRIWSAVEDLERVGPSTVGHDKYLMSERNVKRLRVLAARDRETRLFLSDIAWPMNNR